MAEHAHAQADPLAAPSVKGAAEDHGAPTDERGGHLGPRSGPSGATVRPGSHLGTVAGPQPAMAALDPPNIIPGLCVIKGEFFVRRSF